MKGKTISAIAVALVTFGSVRGWSNVAYADPENEDPAALVAGNTRFAVDLYTQLSTEPGNLILSPYSISTALAMTYGGARNKTARQMAEVLHFPMEGEHLHSAFCALESSVNEASAAPQCTLSVANALWGQQGYGFLDEFLSLNRQYYGARFREVDFVNATEPARQAINDWVAKHTEHMIPELLLKGDLDAADVLVLTNAIYFKGNWAQQFDPQDTKPAPFWTDAENSIDVPMMRLTGPFAFAGHDNVDVLEMPYAGVRLSMVLLLPHKRDGLTALEQSLTSENLDRWLSGWEQDKLVQVSVPRFKLGFRTRLDETLRALGMTDAFSASKADFSGMTGRRDLFIGMVVHQAQIDVNEEGAEAAAATAVKMKRAAPAAFVADHPFLFLIRDTHTGSVLFMGRVANPRE